MLVKEYRIPLPLSLEEYRIAQLFMIQKKSRLESTSSDSAVEIIENAPYEDGPGGNGQYTKKIYHIGSHLPGWLKSLLPKTALRIEEEAWNAYPYTKTRFSCPFIEKFFIDLETYYLPDYGQSQNVFKLSDAERKSVAVDFIDPVKDPFPPKEYIEEEDPHIFVSKKTGRGPLEDDWLENFKNKQNNTDVMCAYKLITVEFKYWGMQSKIENFIQNGLRNPMLVGHRQAWSWQDEWYGLTIEDIRQLEKQAQLELSQRIGKLTGENTETNNFVDQDSPVEDEGDSTLTSQYKKNSVTISESVSKDEMRIEFLQGHFLTNEEQQLGIHMKHIEQSESDDDFDDDTMFYDALETLDDASLSSMQEARRRSSSCLQTVSLDEDMQENNQLDDMELVNLNTLIFVVHGGGISDYESDLDMQNKDFETFKEVFYGASDRCYPGSRRAISIELINCTLLSTEIMIQLKSIHGSSQRGCNVKNDGDHDHIPNSFPFSLVPMLITQSLEFQNAVHKLAKSMNDSYQQYKSSLLVEEKNHEVYIVADCIGGLLVYHALTEANNPDTTSMSEEALLSGLPSQIQEDTPIIPDFDFVVSGIFFLGSPIGLIAFKEKLTTGRDPPRPHCGQIYNLFHPFDPMCFRLEPMIDQDFTSIVPLSVPRHQGFPYNFDLQSNETGIYDTTSMTSMLSVDDVSQDDEVKKKMSTVSTTMECRKSAYRNQSFGSQWWGTKRIDYLLCCPQGLQQFPMSTLVHLCYNSYWESKDLVTFILWQILNEKYSKSSSTMFDEVDGLTYIQPIGKWVKKRTSLKIKNMSPNHRANDAISVLGAQPVITGKFAYGPVAMVTLSNEMVDVYIKRRPNFNEWKLLGSEVTDSHGRLLFTVPSTDLEAGVYSVKMVARGDHSFADCNMAILPPQSEAVVFSVDSSFLASISLSGSNPKIRGGAVDAVRHWQELGYFIIYVSSRLLFQKYQVMSWLSQHNFPFGIVSFCDTVSTDFQKYKINFLKNITLYECVDIHAAYGSSRDIPVYVSALKLPPQKVFLLGKKNKSKKSDVQWITSGYAAHLSELKTNKLSRRSNNSKKILLTVGNFGILEKSRMNKKRVGGEAAEKAPQASSVNKSVESKDINVETGRHLHLKRFHLRKTRSNPSAL